MNYLLSVRVYIFQADQHRTLFDVKNPDSAQADEGDELVR
jgi:hypothetical protein